MMAFASIAGLAGSCDSGPLKYPIRDAAASSDAQGDGGTIQIAATANQCPAVALTISPTDATVGGRVMLGASASDPDVGDKLTYSWTAGAGSFSDASAAQTSYLCASAGPQTVTVTVSDGRCTSTESVSVFCFGLSGAGGVGGNAVGGSGAGTGGRNGAGGSVSAGGAGGAVTSTGGAAVAGTGGSVGAVAGAGGSTTGIGTGGVPLLGTGGAAGTGGPVAGMCVGDPWASQTDPCGACTAANCVPATDSCSLDVLGSDARRQKCLKLYCCIYANGCSKQGDSLGCWCGSSHLDAAGQGVCITMAGAADGPCKSEVEDAAETTDPQTIKQRFVDPAFPVGGAVNLASCQGSFCAAECGIP